jgi:small GTP-binding protein
MLQETITGVLYVRFDDVTGTTPLTWYPDTISERKRMLLGIKSISLLTGEEGFIPDEVVYIPLPSLKAKALIKYLKWKEPKMRGGSATSALIILYPDQYDAIYYKYRNQLNELLNQFSLKLIKTEKKSKEKEKVFQITKNLYNAITDSMAIWKKQEKTQTRDKDKEDYENELIIFKTLVIGDAKVGKTSIILRFTDHAFSQRYLPTIGVNITQKDFMVEDTNLRLMLWDIAGQEKFSNLRRNFFLGAQSVILVFDLTNPASFKNLKNWYSEIMNALGDKAHQLIGVIFGNKYDLSKKRKVSKKQANSLAQEIGFDYIETSALTGYNIHQAFYQIAKKAKTDFS